MSVLHHFVIQKPRTDRNENTSKRLISLYIFSKINAHA